MRQSECPYSANKSRRFSRPSQIFLKFLPDFFIQLTPPQASPSGTCLLPAYNLQVCVAIWMCSCT
jgi:hypothetical protein